jgi:iron(III) transport system permease protein
MNAHNRRLTGALLAGASALTLLPWYSLEQGFFSGDWLFSLWGDETNAPALGQLALHSWLGIAVALRCWDWRLHWRRRAPRCRVKKRCGC